MVLWLISVYPHGKEHFMHPHHLWEDEDAFTPDGVGEVGSLACGDQMKVGIKVKDEKSLI